MIRPLLLTLATLTLTATLKQGAGIVGGNQETSWPALGEHATYRASWGIFGRAGNASLVVRRDSLKGDAALHATLEVKGGIPGARINERLETWMDPTTIASRQYLQRTRYPGFSRDRVRQFDAVNRRWSGFTNAKADSGQLPSARPIDDLSAIFLARTLPLAVGSEIVLNDYWRSESNPIRLKVLRMETVTVPAGTYHTIVIRPVIRTSSMFAEDGEAEVYLSTGPRRELVMLKAQLKVGTLVLKLERYVGQAQ